MLTDQAIRSAKPGEKPYRITDGRGLFLLIKPNGGKLWRYNYRFNGLQKTLALGVYPDTSAKLARQKLDDARQLLAKGVDPSGRRQAEKVAVANTFESVAREWLTVQEKKLAATTYAKAVWTLETLIFPRCTVPSDRSARTRSTWHFGAWAMTTRPYGARLSLHGVNELERAGLASRCH